MTDKPEYSDDPGAYEFFASDLHHIGSAGGGVVRLTFVVERATDRGPYVTPVVNVLVPAAAIEAIKMRLAEAAKFGASPPVAADREGATTH